MADPTAPAAAPSGEQVAEWARLAEAATPGPWEATRANEDANPEDQRVCHVDPEIGCIACLALLGESDTAGKWTVTTVAQWKADAAFIAASRTAVPALATALAAALARAEAAEREAVRLREALQEIGNLAGGPVTDYHPPSGLSELRGKCNRIAAMIIAALAPQEDPDAR